MDETKDRRKQANLAKRGEKSIRRQVILFLIGCKNHTFTLIGKVIIVSENCLPKKHTNGWKKERMTRAAIHCTNKQLKFRGKFRGAGLYSLRLPPVEQERRIGEGQRGSEFEFCWISEQVYSSTTSRIQLTWKLMVPIIPVSYDNTTLACSCLFVFELVFSYESPHW